MSVNKWAYEPSKCDGDFCIGDCDLCGKAPKGYRHDIPEDWERVGYEVDPELTKKLDDSVNHPKHYTDGKIEVIDFIEDKKLPYHLGNVIKYVCRAGKKDPSKKIEDLQKAEWYLHRYIEMERSKG